MLDHRGRLLVTALGFVGLQPAPRHPALEALRSWLDSWLGIGAVVAGMARQGYDLRLGAVRRPLERASSREAGSKGRPGREPSPMRTNWGALSMISVLLAACSAGIAHRVPTTSPYGITTKQVDADVAECEKTVPPVSGRIEGSERRIRDSTYASCMIARGYTAYVWVLIWSWDEGLSPAVPYNVTQTRPHEQAQVFSDLADCGARSKKETRPSTAAIVGAAAVGRGMQAVDYDAVERVYGGCMGERGYSIKAWVPPARR